MAVRSSETLSFLIKSNVFQTISSGWAGTYKAPLFVFPGSGET